MKKLVGLYLLFLGVALGIRLMLEGGEFLAPRVTLVILGAAVLVGGILGTAWAVLGARRRER